MKESRLVKLNKYDEFTTTDIMIKDKLTFVFGSYVVGVDFTKDADLFYGFKDDIKMFESISKEDFNNCNMIVRLLNWNINKQNQERYFFRVLKSNKDEIVDFEEEDKYLRCRVATIH